MSEIGKFVTAEEAIKRLRVSRPTLYSYVSRGLIRSINSESGNADPRRKVYAADDIDLLIERRKTGRKPDRIAAETLDFGLPVLESELTLIEDGSLFYRGRNAIELAERLTFEEVAAFLWGAPDAIAFQAPVNSDDLIHLGTMGEGWDRWSVISRTTAALANMGTTDLPIRHAHESLLHLKGAFLIRAITAAIVRREMSGRQTHVQLAEAWSLDPAGADLLRFALVLLADHELNASTFAARVAASTGASLSACVIGGLSALSGPLHGSASDNVRVFMEKVDQTGDPAKVIDSHLRRDERVPGVGHPLYPEGDPRARAIISRLSLSQLEQDCLDQVRRKIGHQENVDFALVLLERHLRLPAEAAIALFAIGRSAGWIAHALEQNRAGQLIRPRARYTGVHPSEGAQA